MFAGGGQQSARFPLAGVGRVEIGADLEQLLGTIGRAGEKVDFKVVPRPHVGRLRAPPLKLQRDERLGWMGDAEVFWRTASFNANLAAFSRKFTTDIREAQSPAGAFTDVSPRVGPTGESVAGWADAGVMVINGASNALGQYWWTRALHLAPTSAVVPFNYFSLVWAMMLGFVVWGDIPSLPLLAGSAIVVASGLFLLWSETRR